MKTQRDGRAACFQVSLSLTEHTCREIQKMEFLRFCLGKMKRKMAST